MLTDPMLPLLPRGPKHYRAWPKSLCPGRIEYHPLSRILTMAHEGDAHLSAYSVPTVMHRLGTDPPAYARVEDGVPMCVLLFDVDCAAAHRATGGTSAVRADDAWWRALLARIERLDAAHPGAFAYRTRGGGRIVYRLPVPHVIVDAAGEVAWKRLYLSRLAYLARVFGIVADPSISDWPRAIRAPHVTRDDVFSRAETWGDPRAIGELSYDPDAGDGSGGRADIEHAKSLGPTWAPALRILARNAEPPARVPRAPRTVSPRVLDAGAWSSLAADLGRALRRHHGRHGVHLALAGACYARGVPLDRGPELARAICAASGETDDRPQVWQTTADRVRAGQAVTGYGHLAQHWPDLAAIVDAAFPACGGAREIRDELDRRGSIRAVAAGDAAPIVRAALADAPPGLSVVRVTEGAGKTRAAVDVLRARAEAVGDRESVPSHMKTLYVASSHAVASEVSAALAGLRGEYLRGVLSVPGSVDGKACRYHVPLSRLAAARHSVQSWCEGVGMGHRGADAPCPAREGCPARDGVVVPFGGQGTPAVVVTVHALLAQGLAWAGANALVVIDEDPQPVETIAVSRHELEAAAGAESVLARTERWRAPVIRALAAGLERGELPRGADALQAVFARGYEALVDDPAWCDAVRSCYPASDPDLLLHPSDVLHDYAIRAAWSESRAEDGTTTRRRRSAWAPRPSRAEFARVFSGVVTERFVDASRVHAEVARLVAGVIRSAPPGVVDHAERGVAAVEVDHGDPTRRVLRGVLASAAVGAALSRPGPTVLLDATADMAVVRAIAQGNVPVLDVVVRDGAPVTRRLLYWSGASRKTSFDGGDVRWREGLERYLRAALANVVDGGATRVGLFTWKALADRLRSPGDDPVATAILGDLAARGVTLTIGHYGHARGRNDWAGCDALVSVGDPRPNVGASRAVAAVLGLAAEHAEVYRRATAAEVSQVAGRLRAPWRSSCATHVHVGTVVPASWDASAEVMELPKGSAEGIDAAAVLDAVRVYGSARVGAAVTGVGERVAETIASNDRKRFAGRVSPTPQSNAILNTKLAASCGACDTLENKRFAPNRPLEATTATPAHPSAAVAIDRLGGAAAVARLLGVGRATVYHWRSGARPVPQDVAQRLAEHLAGHTPAMAPTGGTPMRFATPPVEESSTW